MIKAEDKTIKCIVCNTMVVLSGYNTTICPSCWVWGYGLDQAMLELKNWIDRLEAEGKNPEEHIDELVRQIKRIEVKEQKIVSLSEWRELKELFQDESDPPSEIH